MAQTVQDALKAAKLYTDEQDYLMITLPPRAITAAAGIIAEIGEPFCTVIADKDEVTLIIPADALKDFERRIPGYKASEPYRLLTFDVELEPTLTGFMAVISRALADAGIPIIPLGAFTRDHLLVPSQHVDRAIETLKALQKR